MPRFGWSPNFIPRTDWPAMSAPRWRIPGSVPDASRIFAGELLHGAPHIMLYLGIELRHRVADLARVIAGWSAKGLMDPINPVHLLFNIWAMTQTYADFDVQIRAVLGKVSIDD